MLPTATLAQDTAKPSLTVVGKPFYGDSGHKALYVVTGKAGQDHTLKAAGIVIEFEKSDDHYQYNGTYDKQMVAIVGADEWKKFLTVWKKACALPVADNYFKDFSYFDGDTMLDVGKDSRGEMSFTMGSKPDAQNVPQEVNMFYLPAKDVPAFDADLKTASLFFRK
jgi:hypothetical protein